MFKELSVVKCTVPFKSVLKVYASFLFARTNIIRYQKLGEALFAFLLAVRDGHSAVTRQLLTAYAGTLDTDVKKDFSNVTEKLRRRFFARWRRNYGIVDRRISGMLL